MTNNALRLQGPWEVRRKIKVSNLTKSPNKNVIEQVIKNVSGVRAVVADWPKRTVTVRYEVTETDYRALLDALSDAGFTPSNSWWARHKTSWYQGLDLTGRENAGVKPAPCCNKPPRKIH